MNCTLQAIRTLVAFVVSRRSLTISLLYSVILIAPSNALAGAWTQFLPVKEVYTYSSGYVFLTLDPYTGHVNPDECVRATPLRVEPGQANAKALYKMLLTAKASGKKVSAYVGGCSQSYPKVLHMRMRD